MSYCANTYRINFERLQRVRGSRDQRLLAELTNAHPDDGADADDYDEDEERPPAFSAALAAIVNGDTIEDGYWPTYADASDAIYERFGTFLDSNAISPSSPQFLHSVTDTLDAAGLGTPIRIFDSSRVPPLLSEPPEAFPILSHMTPAEVLAARGRLQSHDWSSEPQDVQEAIRMVARWIEEAAARGEGLVCCYG